MKNFFTGTSVTTTTATTIITILSLENALFSRNFTSIRHGFGFFKAQYFLFKEKENKFREIFFTE